MPFQFSRYFAISTRDKAWGLYVTGVGHAILASGCEYPPPSHPAAYLFKWERGRALDEFALLYIKDGRGEFSSNETGDLKITAGDVLLLAPGQWHRYRPDTATGWEEFWVTFEGHLADAWRSEGFIDSKKPLLATNLQFELDESFERMMEIAKRQIYAPYLMAGICHSVIGTALSLLSRRAMSESDGQLRKAAEYLRNHPSAIDLDWLARHNGMSPSTFRRRFHKSFDCSPGTYLARQRIGAAKRYLAETNLPLKSIAYELGYSTEFYFMRVFKRQTGYTPSEWRHRR